MCNGKNNELPDVCEDWALVHEGVEVTIPGSAIPSKAMLDAIRKLTASYEESARKYDYNGIRILSFDISENDLWQEEVSHVSDLLKRHSAILERLREAAGEEVPENVRIALVVSHEGKRFSFAPLKQ